ncbi:energy-coupled thiamine transporter ThiT [Ligilactobacillus saerimneri]|uniref:Proton-coupled thiamine transporter n=1 Tax=Ligilactobacillus saerimneri 30a TaxID=1227363 RepID=M5J528_9LACO|nr:energy-coupled thiamine transporter ThiT [Ligilactobacillus saerimneri]EKW98961.1 hypothetical protein D271_04159 [Ligilactobacillus saerimneri 30a]
MTEKTKILVEGALFAALATLLSVVIPNVEWGDLSLGLIPLVLYSVRRGVRMGLLAGLLWGLLIIVSGHAYILNIWQGLLEYPVANLLVGLAGLYTPAVQRAIQAGERKKERILLLAAVVTAIFLKYFVHFIAGIIFWGSYVQWGLGPILYSLVVNGGSFILNIVVTGGLLLAMTARDTRLLLPQNK